MSTLEGYSLIYILSPLLEYLDFYYDALFQFNFKRPKGISFLFYSIPKYPRAFLFPQVVLVVCAVESRLDSLIVCSTKVNRILLKFIIY